MIISANQPYFCPFPGLFYKIGLSDVFVLLDRVQFPRGTTWVSRNRFKNDKGTLWITVPVWKKGMGLQRIDQVRICQEGRWQKKHLESIYSAYANSPYLADHWPFLVELFSANHEKILDLNLRIIEHLREALKIKTEVMLMSDLGIDARGSRLLVDICTALGGSRFLAQNAAAKFMDHNLFESAGIQIDYCKYPSPVYPQLWGDFIANLSAFDLVFNCGPKAHDILFR